MNHRTHARSMLDPYPAGALAFEPTLESPDFRIAGRKERSAEHPAAALVLVQGK